MMTDDRMKPSENIMSRLSSLSVTVNICFPLFEIGKTDIFSISSTNDCNSFNLLSTKISTKAGRISNTPKAAVDILLAGEW